MNSHVKAGDIIRSSLKLCVLIMLLLFRASVSFADTFTAKTLGDYGDVTVMETTGSYNAKNPDGTYNDVPRQTIAKEFFRLHKDEYDFLVIFSNFPYSMPDASSDAFYMGVRNDTRGIGLPIYDNSALFGSNKKLQGTIDMGDLANLVSDPLDPSFENTLSILSHEMLHRWAAHVRFLNAGGSISNSLLGKNGDHWSFLLDTSASLLYGNQWQDNGNGTFTSIGSRKYYSPLDLYLMGMRDKSLVPSMLLIDNPDIDPQRMPQTGETISGTPTYVSIDNIIAVEGERVPNASTSQKSFRTAFIYIVSPGTFVDGDLDSIENIRENWTVRHSILTDGASIVDASMLTKNDVPVNPGIVPPSVTPRNLPPNIDDAVAWLVSTQGADGSWLDLNETVMRDTSEALMALGYFSYTGESRSSGIDWLKENHSATNSDYLARQITALSKAGVDVSNLISELMALQNPDGGWGVDRTNASDPRDTGLALKALGDAGYSDSTLISKALAYLKTVQNSDNGWCESSVETISTVLSAFLGYKGPYQLDDMTAAATTCLLAKQNTDGGFGSSPSTIYDTSTALVALSEINVSRDVINNALAYINGRQSGDGSWNKSSYQTALSVEALWRASVDADLSIDSSHISLNPSTITSLPAQLTVTATVANYGRTDVQEAVVALFDVDPSTGNKIAEQKAAFPGGSNVQFTFPVTITDGKSHAFYISVDPENIVKESNKGNNVASVLLQPQNTYDFEVRDSEVSFSQNPVDIYKQVGITSKIYNHGTMNAYSVHVRYFIETIGGNVEIAESTIDVPANGSVTDQVNWKADRAGENLRIVVQVDPSNFYQEISEDNNRAVAYLKVNGSTDPNLVIEHTDISVTPNPVNQLQSVSISAVVRNNGFSTASDIQVDIFKGVPGSGGVRLGGRTIPSLAPGESAPVTAQWTNIAESGDKVIVVKVDPLNLIKEVSEDDNEDFASLKVLSLPDLSVAASSILFTPPAPKIGDIVSVTAAVRNEGDMAANNVTVSAYEGSTLISSQTIPLLAGNSSKAVSFPFDTTGKSGAYTITITADPANAILEGRKDNNSASKTLGIQNGNLWVTEQYISPNGDGIKDSTMFFFRLDISQTVKVVVANKIGEIVRTYSETSFTNVSSGSITWDGLGDDGRLVPDGQYQIRVVSLSGSVIGSLTVSVDTNRSPITEAIGTKYLVSNNLSCQMPQFGIHWFPDDSGIDFLTYRSYYYSYQGPFPAGLYSMSPDGSDVLAVKHADWGEWGCFNSSCGLIEIYSINGFDLSPDGNMKILYVSKESYEWNSNYRTYDKEIWLVDRDGANLKYVDSYLSSSVTHWSPDSKYLVYNSPTEGLILFDTTTSEKTVVGGGDSGSLWWSPDGRSFIYYSGLQDKELRMFDLAGISTTIISFNYSGWIRPSSVVWLSKSKIAISYWDGESGDYGEYLLRTADLQEGTVSEPVSRLLYPTLYETPDLSRVAYLALRNNELSVDVLQSNGDIDTLYKFPPKNSCSYFDFKWTPDSTKGIINRYCDGESTIRIVDVTTKEVKSFVSSYILTGFEGWLSDGITLLTSGYNNVFAFNYASGELSKLPDLQYAYLSPFGKYLYYYKSVDISQGCYSSGNKYSDLWVARTLLNLTAELWPRMNRAFIELNGTAADLNFEGWRLEYSAPATPDQWNLITVSDTSVVSGVFSEWTPPSEGTFFVRLTVWDKAGNTNTTMKSVSWRPFSSISGIYKSTDIFSPNGDGVKDEVELHYRVISPSHLTFNIFDESGNLLKSLEKDYAYPTNDFISWDGKDEAGYTVPDGKYRIKVSDYEFFVEIDNTPPDVNTAPGASSLRGGCYDYYGRQYCSWYFGADLSGYAYDMNIKNWVLEYGEGDNPSQWTILKQGSENLAAREHYLGNFILPPQSVEIQTYRDGSIGWLGGKKFRMTAEDLAGNRSSIISDMTEERIVLAEWDLDVVSEQIPASKAGPGLHYIWGFETIYFPIVEALIQYWDGTKWNDAADTAGSASEAIYRSWDNSTLNLVGGYAVRIKAVDSIGRVFYSNTISTPLVFSMDLCKGLAINTLFADMNTLGFQVRSGQDSRYADWTYYDLKDISKGDLIPHGLFNMPWPGNLIQGASYQFKMTAVGADGKVYDSNIESYPKTCNESSSEASFNMKLNIDYKIADCDKLSDNVSVSVKIDQSNSYAVRKRLSYFIQKPEGRTLLREFDLTKESPGSITIKPLDFSGGSYPVEAVLSYVDTLGLNELKEISASDTLVIDHTKPVATITYPGRDLILCPVIMPGSSGAWTALPIEGTVTDNSQIKQYQIFYGEGDVASPSLPAMTREGNKSTPMLVSSGADGRLGAWDITGFKGTEYTLKIEAIDVSGNKTCNSTHFYVDTVTDIKTLSADNTIISPNGDGASDIASFNFEVDEPASVDVRVYKANISTDGILNIDSTPAQTLMSGYWHSGGTGLFEWDGIISSGTAPDGLYAVKLFATDSCGNTSTQITRIQVDNTPPIALISYPSQSDQISVNLIEVKGTASDQNFQSYTLEAGQGESPSQWRSIASSGMQVNGSVLGKWNTYGLEGKWTLRLTVSDKAGNRSSFLRTIDLSVRPNLIKAFSVNPSLFSPNNDGRLDTAEIAYELTDTCNVKIEVRDPGGALKKESQKNLITSGTHLEQLDATGLASGTYTVKVTASLSSNIALTQTETLTVDLDITPPTVSITQPADNAFVTGSTAIIGDVSDINLKGYSLGYEGPAGVVTLDSGTQNRSSYSFGTIPNSPEGEYTIILSAEDAGENKSEKRIKVTLDNTPPKVILDSPKSGEYFGAGKSTATISGTITESNLDSFVLKYGTGQNPTQWTELTSGTSLPLSSQLSSLKAGKNDGLTDGIYTLSLYAKDKAGQSAETAVNITIDNTLPDASITQPASGGYVKSAMDVQGTAFDLNLDKYTLDVSEGTCASAFKWAALKTGTAPVKSNTLARWQSLPNDGAYCLRLTVTDKSGNQAVTKTDVTVDTHPPQAPSLSASVEESINVRLSWTENDTDVAGYNIIRNGQKIKAGLTETTYLDLGLSEGSYSYTVTALDRAGGESVPSNAASVRIDVSVPYARIMLPSDGKRVSGLVDIKGAAYSSKPFNQYRVSMGQGSTPSSWTLINSSSVPQTYGLLAQWNTLLLAEGLYSLKLDAEDTSGNISTHKVNLSVDNTPPAPPTLVSTSAVNSDVAITWLANTEPDLAGYLIYRNNRLVNQPSGGSGDVMLYIVRGTSYHDLNVPDGTHKYYMIAVDQAGNISGLSNELEVIIDVRAPSAAITSPANHAKIEGKVAVKAESTDLDVASVRFQYRKSGDALWINLGMPVTASPFIVNLDPAQIGLSYGDYDLRAIATDQGGNIDPAPAVITISYVDLTPPAVPKGLKAVTSGTDISLIWDANTETDFDGYNIYRSASGVKTKLNSSLLAQPIYQDNGRPDGPYSYQITAVDQRNNESQPSAEVSASIYAPVIIQPVTPATTAHIQLSGNNVSQSSVIEVLSESKSVIHPAGTANADAQGAFSVDIALDQGVSRFTAKAVDGNGNTSRTSNAVTVLYDEPPAAPTGLSASIDGYDVTLSWNPNTETDLYGYYVYRDDVKLTGSSQAALVSATASSSSAYSTPSGAFDSDMNTSWLASFSDTAWLQADLASEALISRVELSWGSCIGRNYEIQVWKDNLWYTVKKVTGNTLSENTFAISPLLGTDRLRLYITDSASSGGSKMVEVREMKIFGENTIDLPFFTDIGLSEGLHSYEITAVDSYGFESTRSEAVPVAVSRVPIPAPTNLTGSASSNNVSLSWSPVSYVGLAGYYVYKDSGQGFSRVNGQSLTSANYMDAGLANGIYSYYVTAVDTSGVESVPSEVISVTVSNAPIPAPTNLALVSSGKNIYLMWSSVQYANLAGYYVYKNSGQGWNRITAQPQAFTNYTDAGLANGTYSYRVTAVDAAGGESGTSNELTVVVNYTPPQPPAKLIAVGVPEAGAIDLSWFIFDYPMIINIYRGTTSGGPYKMIASLHGDSTAYRDSGVMPGTTYYYVATSIDFMKVESGYSNEASALLPAADLPKPVIYYPTTAGVPTIIHDVKTDIRGTAEGVSYVELFKNGISMGTATAEADDLSQYTSTVYPYLSPDGKKVVYTYSDGSTWGVGLEDIATGQKSLIIPYGSFQSYSPDGSKIVYTGSCLNGLCSYDILSGTSQSLSEVPLLPTTYNFNWSSDGNRLAFTYVPPIFPDPSGPPPAPIPTMRVKDFSANVTFDLPQECSYGVLSPDGSRVAWSSGGLKVLEISTGNITTLEYPAGWPVWNPDGVELAYSVYDSASSTYSLNMIDIWGGHKRQILNLSQGYYFGNYFFSPDGMRLAYERRSAGSKFGSSIWVKGIDESGDGRLVRQLDSRGALLGWSQQNVFSLVEYVNGYTLHYGYLGNGFKFSGVPLNYGENRFYVKTDAGVQSDEIIVTSDVVVKPDLAITTEDIVVSPVSPFSGDQVKVDVKIRNNGTKPSGVFNLDLRISNSIGEDEMTRPESMSSLAPSEETVISFTWNAVTGIHTISAVADAGGLISEIDETNNSAFKQIEVLEDTLQLSASGSAGNIALSWTPCVRPDSIGYEILRRNGNDWLKIAETGPDVRTYADSVLKNDSYTYFVRGRFQDSAERCLSNEVGVTVHDIAPGTPAIFFPTVPSSPITMDSASTDIAGIADAGVTVELVRDNITYGKTQALATDQVRTIPLDLSWNYSSLSPDARLLAYTINGSIRLKDLTTNNDDEIVPGGYSSIWSPDGRKIAYLFTDMTSGNKTKIGVYDIEKKISAALTGEGSFTESDPYWSGNGRISFLSDRDGSSAVWIKNLEDGTLEQVNDSSDAIMPVISPDGQKAAFMHDGSLYISGTGNTSVVTVASGIDSVAPSWSADSKKLAFSATNNGVSEISTFDLATSAVANITGISGKVDYLSSLPSGRHISFVVDNGIDHSLHILSLDGSGEDRAIIPNLPEPTGLTASPRGHVAVTYAGSLSTISPAGRFVFENAALKEGENLFYAGSTDGYGNRSGYSDPISVNFETRLVKDIEVASENIYLYPPLPKINEAVAINVIVRNSSRVDMSNVSVKISVADASGNIIFTDSVTISQLLAGAEEVAGVTWKGSAIPGTYKVMVTADPENNIEEWNETNNVAERELAVVADGNITMNVWVDRTIYSSAEDIVVHAGIINPGMDDNVVLLTQIEDAAGNPVSVLIPRSISLPYGALENFDLTWNTGSTYAGDYSIHAVLKNAAGVLAEDRIPFVLLPDIDIRTAVSADRSAYSPGEDVVVDVDLSNRGVNYIMPEARIRTVISGPGGNIVMSDENILREIFPGETQSISKIWNAGSSPAGKYDISVDTVYENEIVSSATAIFDIIPRITVNGSISVLPSAVLAGNTFNVDYIVSNTGNVDITGLLVRAKVIDPDTRAIMGYAEKTISIAMNGTLQGEFLFQTAGYGVKTYQVALEYAFQAVTRTMTSSFVRIIDGVPPIVTITSPTPGFYNSALLISAIAHDDMSGIARVEYRTDNGIWQTMPLSDPAAGRYSILWSPKLDDEGFRYINVRATDNSGNVSEVAPVAATIDIAPPVGAIMINSGHVYTKDPLVTLTLNASDKASSVSRMCLSDTADPCTQWEDYAISKTWTLPSGDGSKTVYVWYQDQLGNKNEVPFSATIILDTTAPVLTISTLPDGSWTNNRLLNVSGIATDENGILEVSVNGNSLSTISDGSFSYPVILEEGQNTITVSARDLAGNTSTDIRKINFDSNAPVIVILEPADNMKTTLPSLTLKGYVDEDAVVTAGLIGSDPVPANMDGHYFSLPISLKEGTNTIVVTAVDRADNSSSMKRTVTFDDRAPGLSVTNPPQDIETTVSEMTIEGEVYDVTTAKVTITMDNTVVFDQEVSNGVFQQTVTFTDEGLYYILVKAVDELGNESTVLRNVIFKNPLSLPHISLTPTQSSNQLGKDQTVTAQILDNTGSPLAGVPIIFDVLSGPNAYAGGYCSINAACNTDSSGRVSFTYSGMGGLGTDLVSACDVSQVTGGTEACSQATIDWINSTCNSLSSISSNFNGTSITSGNYVWFNSIVKVNNRGTNPATLRFAGSRIQFTSGDKSYDLAVPGAEIIFSQTATMASTVFEGGIWVTTVPVSYSGNVFLTGLPYLIPTGGLPGGINPVTWSGYFLSDMPGLSAQWKWAAAVYNGFSSDSNALGIKAIDGNTLNLYNNSDHAGTPESYKSYIIGGARGGGGSNYTGSYSGTASKTPCGF